MVRETRHLWVGNLPENVREDRIRDHFKRYGRVQSVKVLAGGSATVGGGAEGAGGAGVGGAAAASSTPSGPVPTPAAAPAPAPASSSSSALAPAPAAGGAIASASGAAPQPSGLCAAVAFIDIMSAAKAHAAKHVFDERLLTTVYYEPAAIPSAASASSSPASSQYSTSSGSAPPTNNSRYPTDQHRSSHQRWYNNYATSPTTTGEPGSISSVIGVEGNTTNRRRGRSGSSSGSGSSSRSVSSSSAARSASSSSSRASSPGADHRRKHQWPSSGSSSRPLAICVRNLPQRSSDSSLKDGLFHEYKKHGKVSCVKVVGLNQDRYAVVYFKKPSDVEKALEVSQDKLFFGCKISVGPYQGMDVEDNESRPYETDLDEFHPKATRTLFIGNLEKDVNSATLREKFKHFGKIIEIDIKKPSGGAAGYAFCQFASISSVVDAMRNMDGELVGGSRVKLGFGKSMATNCIWIDGVNELSEKQVLSHCIRIGPVSQISMNSGSALVIFEQVASAQQAVKELRGLNMRGKKLQVDFASRECQEAFYEQLQKQSNNSNPNETRCNNDKFVDANVRNFDAASGGKYNRYDSSPRTRPMSYNRNRISRLISQTPNEHFDHSSEFSDKRFRYDEFSGGSGSEAAYDVSGNSAVTTTPSLQSVVVVSTSTTVPPPPPPTAPNIRHLQKERVHLLEQLEECPSSGDELVSPKKRFKSERSSLSRRPSVEMSNRHHRDISPCSKRRRSSVTSRHHWHTTSPVSRPGTPLHDERPDSPVPTEPRRLVQLPRRSVPMCLPLPRFAAQILARVAPTSPPRPPPGPPPPASPTAQRVPSPASSPGSSPSPAEPSFDERIRSLDERYEKWSGSRTLSISECSERSRFRHHLLDLDVNEVQPSEVMRSVLAKRSVFDEDSKRLESICDKYEAPIRTACVFPSPSATRVSPTPLNSPQSAGRSPYAGSPIICTAKVVPPPAPPPTTPAKGLQYPFPSHPPLVPVSPLDGVPLSNTQLQSGDCAEDTMKNLTSERISANHIDSFNIPRNNNNNISVFNDRVPVSVSFSSETTNSAICMQSLNIQKTQFRNSNLKFETKTKNSELKSPSYKDCNLVNSSEFDINECDIKSKSSNLNNDTLDRRKTENFDASQAKSDSNMVIKDNKDLSVIKPKVSSEKLIVDKKLCEKPSVYSDNRTSSEKNHIVTEKPLDTSEKRRSSKDERFKIHSEKEYRRSESEKRKRDDHKYNQESVDNMFKPIDRLQPNDVIDKGSKECSDKESNEKENFCRELERGEKEQIEKVDKDRYEKEKKEKEKLEKERLDKDRRDKDKMEQHNKEYIEKDIVEKEKVDKERREKEKLEKDRKERDRADKERLEREKGHKEKIDRHEREKIENEKHDINKDCFTDKSEKFEKFKDKEHKRKEDKEHISDSSTIFKDKKRDKEDHTNDRHRQKDFHKKEDNYDHSESKNSSLKAHENKIIRKLSRDDSSREYCRKDSSDSSTSRNSHDSTKSKDNDGYFEIKEEFRHLSNKSSKMESRNRHHDKEPSPKINGKDEFIKTEITKNCNERKVEGSHISEIPLKDKRLSLDDKQRHHSFDSHNEHKGHELKRKERLNSSCSLPASMSNLKRRVGSQESLEHEDSKKPKINSENRKVTERRDSRDSSKYFDKNRHSKLSKTTSKIDDKFKDEKRNSRDIDDRSFKNKEREKDDIDKEYIPKLYREKSSDNENKEYSEKEKDFTKVKLIEKLKYKRNLKEIDEDYTSDLERDRDPALGSEFLARLELRSSQEDEKQLALKKELKEKKRIQQLQQIHQLQMQRTVLLQDDKKVKTEERRRDMKEKRISTERKSREENVPPKTDIIRKKSRKLTNSSDTSDGDEPKRSHSIFDIVDDGPKYISMYDKVKARSCKNMQKQEEEKRQEKIKAKFCQLKQSRAKREEKKRSASWDEDSDSDHDHKKSNSKSVIVSSSEDDSRRRNTTDSENDIDKFKIQPKICDEESTDDAKSKLITRKNSRTRIMSDTSDDEAMKKALVKIEVPEFSDIIHDDSEDFDMKHSKLSEKENMVDVKIEPINDVYHEKRSKCNDKSLYGYNLKDMIDDKKSIAECKNNFIKNEHYVKSEENYKYEPKYCGDKYTFFSDEMIISDTRKNNGFSDVRKKHRKKQKHQKVYPSDDEGIVMFEKSVNENSDFRNKLNTIKRRHSNKKDKKREKLKLNENLDDPELRSGFMNFKREDIMKDIFGPISDDEKIQNNFYDTNTFTMDKYKNNDLGDSVTLQESYNLKDKVNTCLDIVKLESVSESCSLSPIEDDSQIDKFKEEMKRRKEKKRKERKSLLRDDENSLDVDAAGKAIEANLCDDIDIKRSSDKLDSPPVISAPLEPDVFRFTDGDDSRESPHASVTQKNYELVKKENREKKKKKKKNKEDRQNKKDHYHHNHREKIIESEPKIIPEIYKSDFVRTFENEEIEVQPVIECKPTLPSPSLPRLTDSPPLSTPPSDSNFSFMKESLSPKVASKPVDSRRLSDKFIPGFGVEIDETISENAVKSISEFDNSIMERKDSIDTNLNVTLVENTQKCDDKIDEKPRAIISQEETEDAVAALLGESFGSISETFTDCYTENTQSPVPQVDVIQSNVIESIPDEEAEEMRQAVQNLNESELEIKPDTPQSENDLQIDTDTDDGEDTRSDNQLKLPKTTENQLVQQQSVPFYPPLIENKPEILKETTVNTVEEVKVNVSENTSQKSDIEEGSSKIIADSIPSLQPKVLENVDKPTTPTVISKTWSINSPKPKDQPLLLTSKEEKPVHITTSILHLKPMNQPLGVTRPLLTAKIPASYQVLNSIPRPTTVFNSQSSAVKPHEQHVIYQGQPSIMISPRMANDTRLHNSKTPNHVDIQPKVSNLTILATGSSNLSSAPTNLTQRSPNQITVVRVQSPLSPIQTSSLPVTNQKHPLLSPGHPNAVIIQNQNLNRISVAPVVTLPKPNNMTNMQQSKPVIQAPNAALIQHSTLIPSCDIRKTESANKDTVVNSCKLTLSTSNAGPSQKNSSIMVQNILVAAPNQCSNSVLVTPRTSNPIESSEKGNQSNSVDNGIDESKSTCINSSLIKSSVHSNNEKPCEVSKISTLHSQEISNNQKLNNPNLLPSGVVQCYITSAITSINKTIPVKCDIGEPSDAVSIPPKLETNSVIAEKSGSMDLIPPTNSESNVINPNNETEIKTEHSINKSENMSFKNNIEPEKPKSETDFEDLLKHTSIVTKIEKPSVVTESQEDISQKTEQIDNEIDIVQSTDTIMKEEIEIKTKDVNVKEENEFLSIENINKDSVIKKVDAVPMSMPASAPTSAPLPVAVSVPVPVPMPVPVPVPVPVSMPVPVPVSVPMPMTVPVPVPVPVPVSVSVSVPVPMAVPTDVSLEDNKTDMLIIGQQKEINDKEDMHDSLNINHKPLVNDEQINKIVSKTVSKRGGRTRNKKSDDNVTERIQTRQGSKTRVSVIASRRGRGRAKIDKRPKSISTIDTSTPGDVYDFHEDSGDEIDDSTQSKGEQRPRLILTIKSPVVTGLTSTTPIVPTLPVKEVIIPSKPPVSPVQVVKEEKSEDFQSPVTNTRKSRRLLEKDVTRNSVDDVIEDVVKNTNNRLGSSVRDTGPIRRSARQNIGKNTVVEKTNLDLRKSPRSIKKIKDQKLPDAPADENVEKNTKKENVEISDNEKIKSFENKFPKSDQPMSKVNVPEPIIPSKKGNDKSSISDPSNESNKSDILIENNPEITSVITSVTEPENMDSKSSTNSNSAITSKINENKLLNESSEELMLDPVTGDFVYVRNSSDDNPVTNSDSQTHQTTSVVHSPVNSRVIVDPKVPLQSVLTNIPKTCSTEIISSSITTSAISNPISTVKAVTPNIHVTSSRIPTIVPSSNVIATTTNIHPAPQNIPLDVKISSQITSTSEVVSFNKTSQSVTSMLPVSVSASENTTTTVLKSTIGNILTSSNQVVPVKGSPIMTVPLSKSNGVSTISIKPVLSQCNPLQNLQSAVKIGTNQVNSAINLNKAINPSSPSKIHPNIQSKIQVAQQPKSLVMQPQLAHPPQKQLQGIHIGQAGALGPGTVGPSLPRGAQGQHGSPPLLMAKHLAAAGPQPVIAGANSSRVSLTAIPTISPQGQAAVHTEVFGSRSPPPAHQQTSPITPAEGVYPHFVHQHYQQYFRTHQEARTTPSPYVARSPHGAEGSEAPSPPLDRRLPGARVPHPPHSPSLNDRNTDSPQVYSSGRPLPRVYLDNSSGLSDSTGGRYYDSTVPPPAHTSRSHTTVPSATHRMIVDSSIHTISKVPISQTHPGIGINIGGSVGEEKGPSRGNAPAQGGISQTQSPPGPTHASHAPREADSLMMLLRRYPVMWQGLLALKNDAAAVQMHFVHGNPAVAGQTLPHNGDGSTPPLRIAQRMRLEPVQLEAVARKMQMENEHCMLLALPCGRDHLDVLQQSTHLTSGFITYLRRKQAAGIVNVAPPGHHQALFTVHIFPSCEFANENLERIAPDLLHRVEGIAHLLIVIATV